MLLFALVAGLVPDGSAQSPSVLLRGKVLDPALAPIAGARITAVSEGASVVASTVSGPTGEFALELGLQPYSIRVAAEGFSNASRSIRLPEEGANPSLEFVLTVSAQQSTVTVVESAGYLTAATATATRTLTPLRDIPQSVTVISKELIRDQMMMSIADVVRYIPGITAHQGENNRDQMIIRGNSTSADFFVNGQRDDVQYYRDLYNLERVEAIKGPNAMIFGRGGGGGVINRVTKEAGFSPLREVSLQGGSFGNKRFAVDFDQPVGEKIAFRLNGVYENSDSFRKYVNLERYGISPTATFSPTSRTKITLGYENFHDRRVSDRGVTSFGGRPAAVPIDTYYGNPSDGRVRAGVSLGSVMVDHQIGRVSIRNRTQFGAYDRFYQNYVPGVASADKSLVALSAYNNATERLNMFNQTDVSGTVMTGQIRHTLLGGVEVGRQLTDNFRSTGYFDNTATSLQVPFSNPVISTPVAFRQSATDANNHLKLNLGATYLQDQVRLSRFVQFIGGIRFDRFDLQYRNNRNGDNLRRIDNLVSPRAGVIFRPVDPVSVYANYSVSYLPSSGDQFSSLTTITQQVKPEKFTNYEAGVKWEASRNLALTAAVYRLDRTNTRSTDPNDPTRIIQTGSQRTNGFEVGATGSVTRKWQIAGGYAYQDAFVTQATIAARAGTQVGQVAHHVFSLWNNYRLLPRLGAGLGVTNRSNMFATIDNSVVIPSYTRVDAAVFFPLTEKVRLQANVENLLDRRYYLNADSNTNISPGSPRAIRVGLAARF
ncbi:MAG: TonB-dependent siderophore receptor [Acidobacteria bacterium]|nr:TonB-dependent siderophore receptor [Acidobacteriota bacterium]